MILLKCLWIRSAPGIPKRVYGVITNTTVLPNLAVCISWPLALCLALGSGSGPWFQVTALAPNLYLVHVAPNLYLQTLAPNVHLPTLALNLYLPALTPNLYDQPWLSIFIYWLWSPICIYRPWPPICIYRSWSTILLLVRGPSLHIPTLTPQFVFLFTALAYNLYYQSKT